MARIAGKPSAVIDWDIFDKLCAMQCTLEEIASWFDCSVETIERRVIKQFERPFADVFRERRGKGKVALRRAQYSAALAGNTALLIFLGKNYLGQADKIEQKVEGETTVILDSSDKLKLVEMMRSAREEKEGK